MMEGSQAGHSAPSDGEVPAIGEHAPQPLQRAEGEETQPSEAAHYLQDKDQQSRELNIDETKRCAQAKSQAIEQEDAGE